MHEIIVIVLNVVRPLRSLALIVSLAALGCHAQNKAQTPSTATGSAAIQVGEKLSPEMARRIEVMIRSRSQISPEYAMSISIPAKSDLVGFNLIQITVNANGTISKPIPFLLSTDGKTLAQFNKFDISQNPKDKVSALGRPVRGGGETAPVTIVGYDDLECPYCAKMHAVLFPAILNRYKNLVRVVYRDFPLYDIHPWAMHAAVNANCLGAVTTDGYWNYIDYVHAHADEVAGTEKTTAKANQTLDKLALDEGARQKVNPAPLAACIQKQDDRMEKASEEEAIAEPLRIDSTPVLFINGEEVKGLVPIEAIYRIIDEALIAAGQTPPPAPPTALPAAPAAQATPAAVKPGS